MSQAITSVANPFSAAILRLHPQALGIAACIAVPIIMGLLAVSLGQDANWDLRNYHWYNAHAALTGRTAIDLAPAHTPTYFNPLLDILFYTAAQAFSAKVLIFLLGVIHGLNFIPLYLTATVLLPERAAQYRGGILAAIAAVGLLGGGHLGLVGTTFFDNVVCLPILFGLWRLLRLARSVTSGIDGHRIELLELFAMGVLVGLGVGLKLPAATFGLGFCAALVAIDGSLRQRVVRTVVGGLGALAGVGVTGGWWMAHLYSTTGNPLFPLFNHIFRSPMALPDAYRDTQFVPGSLIDALTFPFLVSFTPRIAGEIEFTDFRIVALVVVGIATATLVVMRRMPSPLTDTRALKCVAVFLVVSYLAWLNVFAIYRYVVAIEMLAPVVTIACLSLWPLPKRLGVVAGIGVLGLLMVTTRAGDWGRVPWAEQFVEVERPALGGDTSAMVLLTGYTPTAWVVSAFPDSVPFVRIQGFSYGPEDGDVGLAGIARRRVEDHHGPFLLLSDRHELAGADQTLARFGLVADLKGCEPMRSNLNNDIRLCPVVRGKETP